MIFYLALHGTRDPANLEAIHSQGWAWLYGINFLSARWERWAFVGTWFNLSGFWSLAVEEHFYLIWPLVVRRLTRIAIMHACAWMMVIAMLSRAILYGGNSSHWITPYVITPCRMDGLAAGAFVGLALRGEASRRKIVAMAPWVCGASGFMLLGWFLGAPRRTPFNPFDLSEPFNAVLSHSILAMFFASAIAVIISARPKSILRRSCEVGWLRSFGKYSYGLYVYQAFVMVWFDQYVPLSRVPGFAHSHLLAAGLRSVLCIACLFVVAFVSWHVYEKQWLRLKRLFDYQKA